MIYLLLCVLNPRFDTCSLLKLYRLSDYQLYQLYHVNFTCSLATESMETMR